MFSVRKIKYWEAKFMAGATSYVDVYTDSSSYPKSANYVILKMAMQGNYGLTRKYWKATIQMYNIYSRRYININAPTKYGYLSPSSPSRRAYSLRYGFPRYMKANSFRFKVAFRANGSRSYGSWATNYSNGFKVYPR
jgi:hypothetical protein